MLNLLKKNRRVHNNPVSYDAFFAGMQYPGRDKVEDDFLLVYQHRMPRVVAALITHDYVRILREYVDYLSLAFVAPLGAHNNYRLTHFAFLQKCSCRKVSAAIFFRGPIRYFPY